MPGAVVLHLLTIDGTGQLQVVRVVELVRGHKPGTRRSETQVRLAVAELGSRTVHLDDPQGLASEAYFTRSDSECSTFCGPSRRTRSSRRASGVPDALSSGTRSVAGPWVFGGRSFPGSA